MVREKTQRRLTPLQAIRACCLDCSETTTDIRDCEATDCPLYGYRMGHRPKQKTTRPMKTIRTFCLECVGGSAKYVIWCTCDGVNSTRCHLWPYRFGSRPRTIEERHGPRLVTPEMMPNANVSLDDLPVVRSSPESRTSVPESDQVKPEATQNTISAAREQKGPVVQFPGNVEGVNLGNLSEAEVTAL